MNRVIEKQCIQYDAITNPSVANLQGEDMEDVDNQNREDIINETKNMFNVVFESFDIAAQNIQEASSQPTEEKAEDQEQETHIPVEVRVENLMNRRKCFERQYSNYLRELS